jgi:TPR repeat protein
MHEMGRGVSQNYTEAARWYLMAAKQGDPNSQFAVAVMHVNGDGVARDKEEAARWFRRAAENGHPKAAKYLARLQNMNLGKIKTVRLEMMKYRQAVDETSDLGRKVRYIYAKPGQSFREMVESVIRHSGGIKSFTVRRNEYRPK